MSPSPCLSFSVSVSFCLVVGALAKIPQAPYAVRPNYPVPGAQEQIVFEAPYAVPNYVTLESSSWPSASTWATLNSTLGGRLQTLRPWAAVCYTEDPLYDLAKCKTVLSNYTNEYTASLFIRLALDAFHDPLISVEVLLQLFSGRTGRAAVMTMVVH